MRIVLDTNVHVSGIIVPTSPPGRILDSWLAGRFTHYSSGAMLAEVLGVLGRPEVARYLRRPVTWRAEYGAALRQATVLVVPASVSAVPEDPDDDVVLGTAVTASADFLVSGDRHLLALGLFQGIPIVPPRRFLDVLDQVP